MTKQQRIFYGDVPEDLSFYGEVQFNKPLPKDALPGSIVMCRMLNASGSLNALFFFVRGRSYMWHEFEPHSSYLLKQWLHNQNRKIAISRAQEVPEFRPWEEV